MPHPCKDDYITFLFKLIDQFHASRPQIKQPGHPFDYKNRPMICFFVIMILKKCFAFKAMNRWLKLNPNEAQKIGFSNIPSRSTLSRRFKALYETIKPLVAFICQWASPLGEEFQTEVIYEDKSLFKARVPVWHKKDMQNNHIPEKLRNLDTDATWAKSAYHGWVFGYGLHVTCTSSGFPVMLEADTASVSEQEVMDRKEEDILSENIGYLVGDDGYTNFQRTKDYAQEGLLLVTPALHANGKEGKRYHQFIEQPIIKALLQKRKSVIEPLFDLVSGLLGTENNHKQLQLKGKLNVRSFLAFGVLLTQLALLLNSIYGLPFHNISHLLTVFL